MCWGHGAASKPGHALSELLSGGRQTGKQEAIIQGMWSPDGGSRGCCGHLEQATNLPQGQAGDKERAGRAKEQPDARHLPPHVHVPEAWPAIACPAGWGSSCVRSTGP